MKWDRRKKNKHEEFVQYRKFTNMGNADELFDHNIYFDGNIQFVKSPAAILPF